MARRNSRESWADVAVRHVEEYGWKMVPIGRKTLDKKFADDPVVRQLNNPVFVDYPEEATSNPEKIRELETSFPVATVGGLPGSACALQSQLTPVS